MAAERRRSEPDLGFVQRRLGHEFADRSLLRRALTHRSRANEEGDVSLGNERLEFLGDAVLDLVISELLMQAHPEVNEGVLSRARASAVNTRSLARLARAIGMDDWVLLDPGEETSGGRSKPSILANVFEALLGALYLDGGLEPVRRFVSVELGPLIAEPAAALRDAKTRLQEMLQAGGCDAPQYQTTSEVGPPHEREFHVEVSSAGRVIGRGVGRSKRQAERRAAREALAHFEESDS